MIRGARAFGKRKKFVAEYRDLSESYRNGQLCKRTERRFTLNIAPLFIIGLLAALLVSPDSRALAFEIGQKAWDMGQDWLLRGAIDQR